ncbi:MAG: hypothetical protein JSV49_04655 [Thermoplasmata archaeon]|nr:MAG: hypothetical protein JSV49_04655 [Thermoplasmata archaeon]
MGLNGGIFGLLFLMAGYSAEDGLILIIMGTGAWIVGAVGFIICIIGFQEIMKPSDKPKYDPYYVPPGYQQPSDYYYTRKPPPPPPPRR